MRPRVDAAEGEQGQCRPRAPTSSGNPRPHKRARTGSLSAPAPSPIATFSKAWQQEESTHGTPTRVTGTHPDGININNKLTNGATHKATDEEKSKDESEDESTDPPCLKIRPCRKPSCWLCELFPPPPPEQTEQIGLGEWRCRQREERDEYLRRRSQRRG